MYTVIEAMNSYEWLRQNKSWREERGDGSWNVVIFQGILSAYRTATGSHPEKHIVENRESQRRV